MIGLTVKYEEGIKFSLLFRNLIDLAFLPPAVILSAFNEVQNKLGHKSGIEELRKWFDDNYILGRKRNTLRNGNIIPGLLLFSPELYGLFLDQ